MDTNCYAIITTTAIFLCIFFFIRSTILAQTKTKTKLDLPPGRSALPVVGALLWLRKSVSDLVPILRNFRAKHGAVVALRIGGHTAVFVSSHSVAYQALVQNGAVFADRPALPTSRAIESDNADLPESRRLVVKTNPTTVNASSYGPTWRLLRRNLFSEILHPSRLLSYASSRRWVLRSLIDHLRAQSGSGSPVRVVDHFRYAVFRSLCFMCFGEELEEKRIREMESVQHRILESMGRINILSFWPKLGHSILFRSQFNHLKRLRDHQKTVLIPPIRSRIDKIRKDGGAERVTAYVDTLVNLRLPEEEEGEKSRDLSEGEIARLCSEFLNAGTDSTSASLQWVMANLVKHPRIQDKLFSEINGVIAIEDREEVKEEDLQKIPYLKAVVLESLRRHPPLPFGLPHAAAANGDACLGGYAVPRNATVNFMVAEMGQDPTVWEDPAEFKPERFLGIAGMNRGGGGGEGLILDVTGSREIKMMPFGAGRRICPGYSLALLQLEYFVANLVWNFEWTAADGGDGVDLSEKEEFAVVMKYPLRAHLSPRSKSKPN